MMTTILCAVILQQSSKPATIALPSSSSDWTVHRSFIRSQINKGLTWQTTYAYQVAIEKRPLDMALRQALVLISSEYIGLRVPEFKPEARAYLTQAGVWEESMGMVAYRIDKDPFNALTYLKRSGPYIVNLPKVELDKKFKRDDFVNLQKNYKYLSDKEYTALRVKARDIAYKKFPRDPDVLFIQNYGFEYKTSVGLKKTDSKLQEAWDNGGQTLMPEIILYRRAETAKSLGDPSAQQQFLSQLRRLVESTPTSDASISWKRRLQKEKKW